MNAQTIQDAIKQTVTEAKFKDFLGLYSIPECENYSIIVELDDNNIAVEAINEIDNAFIFTGNVSIHSLDCEKQVIELVKKATFAAIQDRDKQNCRD